MISKHMEAIVKTFIHREPADAGSKSLSLLRSSAFAVGAILISGMAAAAPAGVSDAQARYQRERAICFSGQSHQDRATCLQEAGAALRAAMLGRLEDGKSPYEKNRLMRCAALAQGGREDCVRRVRGEGTVSGSVDSGGIYRELRTTVPAK